MKIIHYYDRFSPLLGGVETHIENIVQMNKFKFEIVTNAIPNLPLKQRYSDNTVITRFKPYDRTIMPYASKAKSRASFPYRALTDIVRNRKKIQYMNRAKYDVLHVHGPALSMNFQRMDGWTKRPLMTKTVSFRGIKKPKLLTMHGLFSPFTSNPYAERYERNLVGMFDRVICVDDFILKKVKDYGVKDPILLPNSIDTDRYRFTNIQASEKLRVGFVGRVEDKIGGMEMLLELAAKKPAWMELSIVGAGSRKAISEFKANLKSSDVKLFPNLESGKVPNYLAGIDVLFNPVMTGAITRVTLESMACGRPVIMVGKGSKGPIKHGETGYLVENNADNVLQLLSEINEKKGALADIGAKARAIIEKEYSNRAALPKLASIYRDLVIGK